MYIKTFIASLLLLFLCSCEQLKDAQPLAKENNESLQPLPEKVSPDDNSSVSILPVKEEKEPAKIIEPKPVAVVNDNSPTLEPEDVSSPIQPEFSEELLSAVSNWNKIPQSVFPLAAVTIKQAVDFSIKNNSGEIIAKSTIPEGSEVVAVGANRDQLLIAPSKSAKMRGTINMDNTDFKLGVAYLFDLRKRQQKEYQEHLKREKMKLSAKVSTDKPSTVQTEDLFEDIPIPGDFGHGKFCICNDCRTQRANMTKD